MVIGVSVGDDKLTPEARREETVSIKKPRKNMDIYWVHSVGSSIWDEMIKIWVMDIRKDFGNTEVQIDRLICGNIYLLKVSFYLYCFHYI